jgi:hypothetical protein
MIKRYRYEILLKMTEYHVLLQYVWNAAGKFARLDMVIHKKPADSPQFTEEFRQFYRRAGLCTFFIPTMLLFRDTEEMEWLLQDMIIPLAEELKTNWRPMCWEMPEFDATDMVANIVLQ